MGALFLPGLAAGVCLFLRCGESFVPGGLSDDGRIDATSFEDGEFDEIVQLFQKLTCGFESKVCGAKGLFLI